MALINESSVSATAYDRAMGGSWSNPLAGAPSISVDISRVIDEEVDGKTVSTELRRIKSRTVPYSPDAIIDPSKYGIDLPAIPHAALYAYIKTLTLDAMTAPEPAPVLQVPPTPQRPKFPPGWPEAQP